MNIFQLVAFERLCRVLQSIWRRPESSTCSTLTCYLLPDCWVGMKKDNVPYGYDFKATNMLMYDRGTQSNRSLHSFIQPRLTCHPALLHRW